MSTPTTNSTQTTNVDPSATGAGRYLVDGTKWGGGLGTGVALTYSFPGTIAYHASPYGAYFNAGEWLGLQTLATGERAAVRSALGAWSAVADVKFVEVADTAATVGELRFAYTSYDTASEYAHAYLPNDDTSAGDVWLSYANWNATSAPSIAKGSDDFHTLLHEIGHSLGLKHSFDAPNAIPAALDNYFYTVMSYNARSTGDSGTASFLPTTPMYYDLLAIQKLYGRNDQHNAGNNTYTFTEGRRYFETIDDAAGIDRIVYSGKLAVTIDLNQGRFSTLSAPIYFDNGSTRATVAIGPNSVIENATGGSGSDRLYGNELSNLLIGRAGNDVLSGASGNDRLFGGTGNDVLAGGAGIDGFYFNAAPVARVNVDRIKDFNTTQDTLYLDDAVFPRLHKGAISSAHFHVGSAAHDSNDYIIYNKANGALIYDNNGTGAGGAVVVATLAQNLTLTASDIVIY